MSVNPRAGLERDRHTHSQTKTVVLAQRTQLVLRCPPSEGVVAASTPSSGRFQCHTPSPAPECFLHPPQAAYRRPCHSPSHFSSCPPPITLTFVSLHALSLPALPSSQKAALPTLFVPLAPLPRQSPHHPLNTDALPAAGKSARRPSGSTRLPPQVDAELLSQPEAMDLVLENRAGGEAW